MRDVTQPGPARRRACAAGRRWRDAPSDWPVSRAASGSATGLPCGHELRDDSWPDWTVGGPDARRLARPGGVVALDLSDQSPARRGRWHRGAARDARSASAGDALRHARLHAARLRHGGRLDRARRAVRAPAATRRRRRAGRGRTRGPRRVLASRGAHANIRCFRSRSSRSTLSASACWAICSRASAAAVCRI